MLKLSPLRLWAAGAALALLVCTPALASETVVEFPVNGAKVVGTLELPDGKAGAPVVLLLHGFTGSRDELAIKDTDEGVFSRTARLLAEKGYASLRIDFRGSGQSGGAWADTTFSGQIADAVAAVDWLKGNSSVDGKRISIIGWSQGGLVAAHAAKARPEVRAVSLWAPVVDPMYTFSSLLGADTVAKALASTPGTAITAKLPWGAETTLKASYYHELPVTSPVAAAAGYGGPLQVIVGTKDTIVAPQPASGQILLNYHDGPEELLVFDTDHVWDAFSGPQTIDQKMVPAALAWFESHP